MTEITHSYANGKPLLIRLSSINVDSLKLHNERWIIQAKGFPSLDKEVWVELHIVVTQSRFGNEKQGKTST